MKFSIDSKDFKEIANRALAVKRKDDLPVHVCAEDGVVTLSAMNTDDSNSAAVVWAQANVEEAGNVTMPDDVIKKIVKMNDTIMVETNGNNVKVTNGKKTYIFNGEKDQYPFNIKAEKLIAKAKRNDIIDTMKNLSCCLSKKDTRPVLTGFNINGKTQKIATCDSYKLASRTVPEWRISEDTNITIPGFSYCELDKVSKKVLSEISIYYDGGRYVLFEGDDFKYFVRRIEEVYPNLEKISDDSNYTFSVSIDTRNFVEALKEFGKNDVAYINFLNGKMYVVSMNDNVQCVENVPCEVDDSNDESCAFDPRFLSDLADIFIGNEKTTIRILRNIWTFRGENGYFALLLKFRVYGNEEEKAKELVEKVSKNL